MTGDFQEIGAQINGDECFFRVWAPNAAEVYPVFEKEGWRKNGAYRLERVQGDFWQGTVKYVAANNKYRFLIIPKHNTGTIVIEQRKIDPAARATLHSNPEDPRNAAPI
jgi:1,4-alpha-glucan branching enzyme